MTVENMYKINQNNTHGIEFTCNMKFSGTEKQCDYAISIAYKVINKVIDGSNAFLFGQKITKQQYKNGIEKVINQIESIKDAGAFIEKYKRMV